jgi:formate dehydrogenase subunit gamma
MRRSVLAAPVVAALMACAVPALAQQTPQQLKADESAAAQQVQRQQTQPLNNAPIWREVRSGEPGYTTVQGPEAGVLVQSRGETWREARVPITSIGGAIIALAILGLVGYYSWRGSIGLHDKPTGRLIRRFSTADRITHWTMGISFAILGLTGLVLTFGKHILLPVVGYTLFAWLASFSKNLHNFVGPIFSVALPIFIVLFIRDNLPRAYDVKWIAKFGGMLDKKGGHVPSGRFNAGEKALFWGLVIVISITLVVTGYILNFPNFGQTRSTMQTANVIHMVFGLLGIAMACFHIYLGTIGMRGAYQAMRTGYVDETWAKEHHEYWYDEVRSGRSRQKYADDVPAATRAQVLGVIQHS